VAIKVFYPGSSDEMMSRARKEAEHLSQISVGGHAGQQHVISYLDSFDIEPSPDGVNFTSFALVMQFADRSLKDVLVRLGPLSPSDAEQMLADVVNGLQAAHQVVWHDDIKPANVLWVGVDGAWKLADLGISRELGQDDKSHSYAPIGTMKYMAPERKTNFEVRPEGDIYSLGLVFHEAVTGQVPADDRDISRKLSRRHHKLIKRCVARDWRDRITLNNLAAHLPPPSRPPDQTGPTGTPVAQPAPRRRSRKLVPHQATFARNEIARSASLSRLRLRQAM
jgi:serine/threonine protein kinase